ncbi:ATP-binding protein [Maribellus maritimus]|uniref:ATP-binding protein n=1 Tax=Maribellus maritimus TaxID=2870838 RepID=UPI001EEC1536|nr:ATP-binding protein [Maribellus maritimus]MCG6188353.1 response regulator [Maribellus maritimus]
MPTEYRKFDKRLLNVSEAIEKLLSEEENTSELEQIESWLNTQLGKIKLQRIKESNILKDQSYDRNLWQDGIMILNSAMEIIHYSGFKNYFSSSTFNYSRKFKFTEFIHDTDRESFEEAFSHALSHLKNETIEIDLKTGVGNLNRCELEIDIESSNINSDRYILYFRFMESNDIQAFDYQSIVFENLPDMDVYLYDKDYRYILCGGREKEKFNLNNSDFIGKKMFDVFDKQTQRRVFPFYNKALNGEYTEGEVRYRENVYYIVAAPVKNHQSKTIAGILISQNVTNDKLLEENLIKSKEQAQKADKAKSIFIANMSHEIRTPLNSILGFTEQLEKTELNQKQEKLINLIKNASDHLLYLVTEIVFLFKLGMDKVYLENIPFSVNDIFVELEEVFSQQTEKKSLDFEIIKDKKLPQVLRGDPFRLKQILMNLLVNAIKYTDKGKITLICEVQKETKGRAEVLFKVSDTGIGISDKDLPYIFDVFEQGNKRTEKIRGGAGLGLGICNRLVNLLKGDIWVESKLNLGSTFFVSLPFKKASVDQLKEREQQFDLAEKLLKGKKILLADDDDHNLILAEMLLKNWRTDYTLVKNGMEAITKLSSEKFDLVLLDIHMPEKDGVQVVKNMHSDNTAINYKTPAVALTANALKSDIHKYLKAGFDDYVIKPFKENELYNKLCNILGIKSEEIKKTNQEKPPMEEKSIYTEDKFNVQELKKAAGNDNSFYNMMLDNFIKNAGTMLKAFNSSLKIKNWQEIGEKAHKAIPSFKFFGLTNLASNFEKIEDLALRKKHFEELPELTNQTILEIEKVIKKAETAKTE